MADQARGARRQNEREDKPARMYVKNNGDIVIPLTRAADGERREVILPDSPSVPAFARIVDAVRAADQELDDKYPMPKMPDDDASDTTKAEHVGALQTVHRDRNLLAFSDTSPHALALLEIIEACTGKTDLSLEDLPSWAGHPSVCAEILSRYMDPFAGREDLGQEIPTTRGTP